MKNLKIFLLLFASLLMGACAQEEGALYENPGGKLQVSFASDKYLADLLPEDGNEIVIKLNRNKTTDATDVPCRFRTTSTLFTMADSTAHFSSGASETTLKISFPGAAQLTPGTTYTLRVNIKDTASVSIGGIIEQTIKALEERTRKSLSKWLESTWLKGELFLILDENNTTELCGINVTYTEKDGLLVNSAE